MRFFFKILLALLVLGGLFLFGWFVTWLLSLFHGVGYSFGFAFFSVFGAVWVSPRKHDRIHKGNCGCPACRRKYFEKDKKVKRDVLEDVPLFCKVFPEGLVGSCGFKYYGYCRVFECSCVRWNELGDKRNYSSGLPNPFEGGDFVE
jgi:hypothetical protein